MRKRKKATITGVGMLLIAGAVLFIWRKSEKQRAKLADWKKEKIENDSVDELDIAWG